MGLFNRTLLHSSTIRMAARGVAFVVLAGTLVGIARYIQTHLTTDSPAATTAVIAALVILEAVLFLLVKHIFRNIA
jgi:uncharacterized membrane protein